MDVVIITHKEARNRGIYPTLDAVTLWESRGYDCTEAKKAIKAAATIAAKNGKGSTD
jgi:hypothetical protein